MVNIDRAFWSRWEVMFLVFIIVVSLVIAGGYVSYRVISTDQDAVVTGYSVRLGDAVTVDYIGMFEDGTVFDTSLQSVAENNTLYPKSLSFTSKTDYSPLNFTVGQGQMISGFDNGVIGMALNQTKTITVTPELGYGYSNESLIFTRNLTLSVPVFEWIGNSSAFSDTFYISPTVGANVKNPTYGWNMTVFYIDPITDAVMIRNNPMLGEVIQSDEGWASKVISVDTSAYMGRGEIIIEHILTSEDVRKQLYTDEVGQQFFISEVNSDDGIFKIDYNREVVGKTLTFKVTLVSLIVAGE